MSWDHRSKRRVVTPDEARIWRAITRDVMPLTHQALAVIEAEAEPPSQAPIKPSFPDDIVATIPNRSSRPLPKPERQLPALHHGHLPSVDKRSAERLKKGEMSIDGRLDLHGLSQDAAHAALTGFLRRGYDSGRRCLLVITGKGLRDGSGVLRQQVPRWLNQLPLRDMVLGFSHARPNHGGEGALYVLIRRKRSLPAV